MKIMDFPIKAGTPRDVSRILVGAYPSAGPLSRFLIRWRPYICPFHELIQSVPVCDSVLDVGCGVGLMSVLLAYTGKVARGVGVDPSPGAIETARAAVLPEGRDIVFRRAPGPDQWPDERFDSIVCIDVLHHVPPSEQRAFIKKLAQVDFTGRIVFKDVSPKPFWMAWASRLHDLFISRQWIHIRSEEEVRRWFEEEGFSVTGPTRHDTLWYSHYLIVAEKRI
ncbi:MAG TPA: class I SAM-dependent methyltransferase [Candidatus Manganitrophaceae bacterium]|nr:class I SAM-dependent methyltransferase [Candidatus Manganitrophaceae bacterium]